MNKEEIEKMELEYINAIRKRIENAMKCEIGLDATLTIGNRIIKLQDRIDKAIEYITTHSLNVNGEIEDVLEVEECEDLLDILRGEDNDNI